MGLKKISSNIWFEGCNEDYILQSSSACYQGQNICDWITTHNLTDFTFSNDYNNSNITESNHTIGAKNE